MLTFGTTMGADAEVATAAPENKTWNGNFSVIVDNQDMGISYILNGDQVPESMTLVEFLNQYDTKPIPGTKITIYKVDSNKTLTALITAELGALGFTPDQNLETTPLSALDALAFKGNETLKLSYRHKSKVTPLDKF
jgi:hypothetical protein